MKKVLEAKYKYIYQGERSTRLTHQFEYYEQTQTDRTDIAEFMEKFNAMSEKERAENKWLERYIVNYYKTPSEDGQTNVDYMIERCERLYTWEEMEQSWRVK